MDPEYGARYSELYERHWWWRAREAWIANRLAEFAPREGFGPILDVGCGDGLAFPVLSRFGLPEGVEPDASLLSDRGRARGCIHSVPYDDSFKPGQRFGLVTLFDVLEHLEDDCGALRRSARFLLPGGRIFATVPAFQALWTNHDDYNHHLRRYTRGSFRELASRSGLKIVEEGYFFIWLSPLKLIIRLKERVLRGQARMPGVPFAPLNSLFYGISRIEQALWGRLNWPFGTSFYAVCTTA